MVDLVECQISYRKRRMSGKTLPIEFNSTNPFVSLSIISERDGEQGVSPFRENTIISVKGVQNTCRIVLMCKTIHLFIIPSGEI